MSNRRLRNVARMVMVVASLLCPLGLAGCGSPKITEEKVTPVAQDAKKLLSAVAESGELGSGSMMIRAELEKLKSSNSSKAEELLKDLDELSKMSDPNQIKAKAQTMADKL